MKATIIKLQPQGTNAKPSIKVMRSHGDSMKVIKWKAKLFTS